MKRKNNKCISIGEKKPNLITEDRLRNIQEELEEAIIEMVINFKNKDDNTSVIDKIESLSSILSEQRRSCIPISAFNTLIKDNSQTTFQELIRNVSGSDSVDEDIRTDRSYLTHGKCLNMTNEIRTLYFEYEDGFKEPIGVSNIKEKLVFSMSKHPSENFDDLLEIIASCLMPSTKSTSPSMISHQLVSVSLTKSIMESTFIIEPSGVYTPDLLMNNSGKEYLIDITSDNIEQKLFSIRQKVPAKKIFVINKYEILKYASLKYDYLIAQSRINESSNTHKIEHLMNRYNNYHNLESVWSAEIYEFFRKGKDEKGRSLREYNEICSNIIYNRIANKIRNSSNEESEIPLEECSRIHNKLIDFLKSKLPVVPRDNEAHIFPISQAPDKLMREEDFDQPSDMAISELVDTNGHLRASFELEKKEYNENDALCQKIEKIFVHYKTKEHYDNHRHVKQQYNIRRAKEISIMINALETKPKLKEAISLRIATQTQFVYDSGLKELALPTGTNYKPCKLRGTMPVTCHSWNKSTDFFLISYMIDPNHDMILNKLEISKPIRIFLSKSRHYHELRFKQRVAKAISLIKSPYKPIEIKHWYNKKLTAEAMVSGLLFKRDSGVAYVSYFDSGKLYRTEQWRLVDLENNKVNCSRMVAFACAIDKIKDVSLQTKVLMLYVISVILTEGPWALSIFLKNYRYYSYNSTILSPKTESSTKKLCECLYDGITKKLSYRLLIELMDDHRELKKNHTPLFKLPIKYLSYEVFLMNCCPSKTYGKRKHLLQTMEAVFEEIELYDQKFNIVKDYHEHFSNVVLKSANLRSSLEEHFQLYENLINSIDQRFTLSPVSIILISSELEKIKLPIYQFQNSCDSILELMTGRASHDSNSFLPGIAASSIKSLIEKYETNSTSLLALKILYSNRLPDISMRMFDKDQVGGNREISILSGEYRILQYITENFFKSLCKQMDNEMLSKANKDELFIEQMIQSYKRDRRFLMSIDQTRWGPNFATSQWSYLCAILSSKTTETYIPSILCSIADYKIFESPPWLHELYGNLKHAQSVIGRIGRSHMGQGIFHATSSFYHSLVTKKIQSLLEYYIQDSVPLHNWIILEHKSFVTSDDCSIVETIHVISHSDIYNRSLTQELVNEQDNLESIADETMRSINKYYSCYDYIVPFFGIKTSVNKNSISNQVIEFNSQYIHKNNLIKNDIKYLYSLIEPSTSGVMLHDYSNCLNSYYCAINSGASLTAAQSICLLNYHIFCLDWKIKMNFTGLPSVSTMIHGVPGVIRLDPKIEDPLRSIYNQSNLRFRTRKTLDTAMRVNNNPLMDVLIKIQLDVLSRSRERVGYKSVNTFYKGNWSVVNDSTYLLENDLQGISFNCVVKRLNSNIYNFENLLNPDFEKCNSFIQSSKLVEKNKDIVKLILKISRSSNLNVWNYILAIKGPRNHINRNSEPDDIMLHLARKEWIGDVKIDNDMLDYSDYSLVDLVPEMKELMVEYHMKSANTATYMNRSDLQINNYFCIETQFLHSIDSIDITLRTIRMTTYKRVEQNHGCTHDYIGRITYKKDNLLIEPLSGIVPFVQGPTTDYLLQIPHYSEILNFTDKEIHNIDAQFRRINNIDEVFLVMSISKELVKMYVQESNDIDSEDPMTFDDFMGNILSSINTISDESKKLQTFLTMESPEEQIVHCKVNPACFMYGDNYFKDRLILNYIMNKLIQDGVVLANYEISGYVLDLINRGTLKIYSIDPNLSSKITTIDRKARAYFKYEQADSCNAWLSILEALERNDPLFSNDDILFKEALILPCKQLTVSSSRLGQEVSLPDFYDLFRRKTRDMRYQNQ